MLKMLYNTTSFDQDLGGWDIGNVTNMLKMFSLSGMSALNFSNTLIGWAGQEVQPNITLDAEGVNICEDGDGFNAYQALTGAPNNWTITYGSSEMCGL
jgi:hypothetical protein